MGSIKEKIKGFFLNQLGEESHKLPVSGDTPYIMFKGEGQVETPSPSLSFETEKDDKNDLGVGEVEDKGENQNNLLAEGDKKAAEILTEQIKAGNFEGASEKNVVPGVEIERVGSIDKFGGDEEHPVDNLVRTQRAGDDIESQGNQNQQVIEIKDDSQNDEVFPQAGNVDLGGNIQEGDFDDILVGGVKGGEEKSESNTERAEKIAALDRLIEEAANLNDSLISFVKTVGESEKVLLGDIQQDCENFYRNEVNKFVGELDETDRNDNEIRLKLKRLVELYDELKVTFVVNEADSF